MIIPTSIVHLMYSLLLFFYIIYIFTCHMSRVLSKCSLKGFNPKYSAAFYSFGLKKRKSPLFDFFFCAAARLLRPNIRSAGLFFVFFVLPLLVVSPTNWTSSFVFLIDTCTFVGVAFFPRAARNEAWIVDGVDAMLLLLLLELLLDRKAVVLVVLVVLLLER